MAGPYYVYLFRSQAGTPLYIGKGLGKRSDISYLGAAKGALRAHIDDLTDKGEPPIVEFVGEHLSESDSLELEASLIAEHGRLNLGDGPLFNKNGGVKGKRQNTVRVVFEVPPQMHDEIKFQALKRRTTVKQLLIESFKEKVLRDQLAG